ncbi:hypothetical protein CBEIBR21_23635 [Clostridium beijerinckii]|uniref:Uncharacterized protein n=1 Tax=Clostridium beijerinckii TaxID=1520 RepID=A0A1S9N0E5_CLOBE|nr:hypothetical protein CBEIBR21_23635 [Clostridium beijerinckii]
MMLCLKCGTQRPNKYKSDNCPNCGSYLKYVEAPAKAVVINLHRASLSVSYATAEVYSYNYSAIHTVNINIGLAKSYQAVVFRRLPDGVGCILPRSSNYIYSMSLEHLLAPAQTYSMLRFETPYLEHTEAKAMLKKET